MPFDLDEYSLPVRQILALDGDGMRPMPLVAAKPCCEPALDRLRSCRIQELFPHSVLPSGAMAGLWLYFSAFDEAHNLAQDIDTPDGSYWHAIVHRQEPDAGNASYWFRRVGRHPIFPALADRIAAIDPALVGAWDPYKFIEYCERAARQGGDVETRAIAIQQAEWELLFDYCLNSASRG